MHWTVSTDIASPSFMPEWSFTEESGGNWNPALEYNTSVMYALGVGPQRLTFSQLPFFRIKVYDSDTGNLVYTSESESVKVTQNQHDFLIWREILRRENLGQVKYNGIPGWLLRRREGGPKCTNCLDPILGGEAESDCPLCFGTGYLSGYFTPQPMYGDWSGEPPYDINTTLEEVGPSQAQAEKPMLMAQAFPETNFKDVWVDSSTNFRFEIQKQRKNQFRGWPINQMLTLSLLPPSDPAYKVQVPVGPLDTPASMIY